MQQLGGMSSATMVSAIVILQILSAVPIVKKHAVAMASWTTANGSQYSKGAIWNNVNRLVTSVTTIVNLRTVPAFGVAKR